MFQILIQLDQLAVLLTAIIIFSEYQISVIESVLALK